MKRDCYDAASFYLIIFSSGNFHRLIYNNSILVNYFFFLREQYFCLIVNTGHSVSFLPAKWVSFKMGKMGRQITSRNDNEKLKGHPVR